MVVYAHFAKLPCVCKWQIVVVRNCLPLVMKRMDCDGNKSADNVLDRCVFILLFFNNRQLFSFYVSFLAMQPAAMLLTLSFSTFTFDHLTKSRPITPGEESIQYLLFGILLKTTNFNLMGALEVKSGDHQSWQDSSSWEHKWFHQISWGSIEWLLRSGTKIVGRQTLLLTVLTSVAEFF